MARPHTDHRGDKWLELTLPRSLRPRKLFVVVSAEKPFSWRVLVVSRNHRLFDALCSGGESEFKHHTRWVVDEELPEPHVADDVGAPGEVKSRKACAIMLETCRGNRHMIDDAGAAGIG